MTVDALSLVFGALADPTRRGLYERLLRTDGATATELADGADITRQAIVKHLQLLVAAGLADGERSGREVRYRATPSGTGRATSWLDRHNEAWNRRLGRLADRAAAGPASPAGRTRRTS